MKRREALPRPLQPCLPIHQKLNLTAKESLAARFCPIRGGLSTPSGGEQRELLDAGGSGAQDQGQRQRAQEGWLSLEREFTEEMTDNDLVVAEFL